MPGPQGFFLCSPERALRSPSSMRMASVICSTVVTGTFSRTAPRMATLAPLGLPMDSAMALASQYTTWMSSRTALRSMMLLLITSTPPGLT